MTYTINHANGLNPILVSENTFDNSTSVYLIGKNYTNYGELFDQNFLWIMEHWASNVSPANPTVGQIWYDLGGNGVPPLLKVYTPKKRWKSIVTVYTAATPPLDPDIGDLWLNVALPNSPGLYIYTGNGELNGWMLVGPYVGVGEVVSEIIWDKAGRPHNVISMKILRKRYTILSPDQSFQPRDYIPGFANINPGFNLINITELSNVRFTGRATDSDRLDGLYAWQFMRTDVDTGTIGTLTVNNDTGLFIGTNNHMRIGADNNNMQIVSNFVNGDMRFYVTRPALYNDTGPFDAFDIYGNGNVSVNGGLTVYGLTDLAGGLVGGSPNAIMKFGPDGAKVTYTPFAIGDTESVKILNNSGKAFLGALPSALQITGSISDMDFSSFDFRAANQPLPLGRIGLNAKQGGSTLSFGTSNDFTKGITNMGLNIGPFGNVIVSNKGKGGPTTGGDFTLTNTTQLVQNPSKHFRVNGTGTLEVLNSAYATVLLTLTDAGNLKVKGDIQADGRIISPVDRLIVTGGHTGEVLMASNNVGGLKFQSLNLDCSPKWCTPRQLTLAGDCSGQLIDPMDGSADVTLDAAVNKLHVPRWIMMTGDGTWAVHFDGSTDVSAPLELANLHVANTYYVSYVNDKGLTIGGITDNPIQGKVPYLPYFDTDHSIKSSCAKFDGSVAAPGIIVEGYISAQQDIIAFDTSDQRLKTNITPITNALEKVSKITGVTYDWTEQAQSMGPNRDKTEAGVLAQDVAQVLPEIVTTKDDGYMAIKYERLAALLIQAVNELSARVEQLERDR